jgi:hypothetical protein
MRSVSTAAAAYIVGVSAPTALIVIQIVSTPTLSAR